MASVLPGAKFGDAAHSGGGGILLRGCGGDGRRGFGRLKPENALRQRILDAALDIVEEQGIGALTQPRVAKAAGLRQSHLTYYFPRKADLFVALLEASHARAGEQSKSAGKTPTVSDWTEEVAALVFDRRRMQFFLGIVLAASEQPDLKPIVAEHMQILRKELAAVFGRDETDPAVLALIDQLRGCGLRALVEGDDGAAPDVAALAQRMGLNAREG
jgi:AcrR family transcriptional regulator